jgi:hypothetical protein
MVGAARGETFPSLSLGFVGLIVPLPDEAPAVLRGVRGESRRDHEFPLVAHRVAGQEGVVDADFGAVASVEFFLSGENAKSEMAVGSFSVHENVLDPRHLETGVGQERVRDEAAEIVELLPARGGIGGGQVGATAEEGDEELPLHPADDADAAPERNRYLG